MMQTPKETLKREYKDNQMRKKISVEQMNEIYEIHQMERRWASTPTDDSEDDLYKKQIRKNSKLDSIKEDFESMGVIPIFMPVQEYSNKAQNALQVGNEFKTKNKSKKRSASALKKVEEKILFGNWMEIFDPLSNRNYYYNKETGESTWEKPLESYNNANFTPQISKTETIDQQIIDKSWKIYFDAKSGHNYYFNEITRQNTWTKPLVLQQTFLQEKKKEKINALKSLTPTEIKPVHKPVINFSKEGFTTLGATTEEEDDDDDYDEEIEEIEGIDSDSDEDGDEFISRPQGMIRNTEEMFKHLTPEQLRSLPPDVLNRLPTEFKEKILSPKPEVAQKPKHQNIKDLQKKTDSYRELKKDRGSFFKIKVKEEKNHTKSFFGTKKSHTVVDQNRNSASGRFSPNNINTTPNPQRSYSPIGGYLDDISSFDVEKSDQIITKRGSYDINKSINGIDDPRKKSKSIFQTLANALGPKERSHTMYKRASTPQDYLTPSPIYTPLSDEDDETWHTDYNSFKPVDYNDYSYVNEDEANWKTKEFDENEEILMDKEEEEIKNPLFEAFIEILNPLYDEVYIYKNEMADELVEYINPLFNGEDTNYLTDLKPEIELLLELQKSLRFEDKVAKKSDEFKLKTLYQCFYGYNLITWIQINTFPHFTYNDSFSFCQEMMNKLLFKNVFDIECTEFDGDEYYRFTDTWEFLVEKQMNVRIFDKKEEIISNPFESRIDSYIVIRNIDNLMKLLLDKHLNVNIYQKNVSKSVGYLVIWRSKYFTELRKQVYKLQKVNLLEFNENMRKSILINIYNLMVLHSLMKCKRPEKLEQRQYSFHHRYYIIGHFKLTIESFEKEIFFDRERNHPLSIQFDPRIHFVLHNASNSSPLLRYYSWDNEFTDSKKTLDYQIKKSTKLFMRTEILINDEEKEIKLPSVFKTYEDHFGNSIDLQIKFISKFLSKSSRIDFLKKTKHYQIDYLSEDTKFNEKTFEEQVQEFSLPFSEVRDNERFRKYFIKYCDSEHSCENINCYQAILDFNKINNPHELFTKAEYIYNEYLSPGKAPQEININTKKIFKVRNEIKIEKDTVKKNPNYIPKVVSTLFEEIKHALNIVMLDTYSRFKLSDLYFQLILNCLDEILERSQDEESVNKKEFLKKILSSSSSSSNVSTAN
eukprot:gene8513-337_t